MPVVYLVSGANRGIGLGIVEQLAERSDTIVFAGARSPDSAIELKNLEKMKPGVVHIVKLTSGDEVDNAAAVGRITEVAGRLDVIIANAGMLTNYQGILDVPTADLRAHWDVNVGGPHLLFQKTLPLLRSSNRAPLNPPKFVVISSTIGSAELAGTILGSAPYRASKNALNFITREMHFEHEEDGLVAFPICPGNVVTDMSLDGLKHQHELTVKDVPMVWGLSVKTSAQGILKIVDEATRETHGGRFVNVEGTTIPW